MKTYKNNLRDIETDEPIYSLPTFRVSNVYAPNVQTIDWGLKTFGIPHFWKFTKGRGIKVAVLDTGYDTQHQDLVPNVKKAKDFTGSSAGVHDVRGHGTHCAGIIAATNNSFGTVGIAPEAELYIGKVLNDRGEGSVENIVDGINWAIKHKVHIISMSFGSPYPSKDIYEALMEAEQKGIILIAAAGNEGPYLDSVSYPAAFDEIIAVGAINQNKKLPFYSSRGNRVDVVAPGHEILSCYPPNGMAELNGTSMAAPFVAGIAALILAKHKRYAGATPATNQREMEEHLRKTALDLGEKGFDPEYGYGLINPQMLLR